MTTPIVHAPCGAVAGIERPGSLAFLGIPFAEVPVGERRFQAPVRRGVWSDVRDATEYGATPQRRSPYPATTIPEPIIAGEDILNLNVFTPIADPSARLSVHVYIHGGGYVSGSHAGSWFDGATYNRDNIVVVTIAYRLGFEGFGWIADAPRNRGLLDMVCALEWVRDNIAAFGGNPQDVTISGQSAGGGAVLSLLSMPAAQGLFHRVIAHSAVIGAPTAAEHEAMGRAFAARAGVEPTISGWSALSKDEVLDHQFAQMRDGAGIAPMVGRLVTEPTAVCEVTMDWGPALDADTLPVAPFDAWRGGFNNHVELLVGATADEFMMPSMAPPAAKVREWLAGVHFEPRLREYALAQLENGSPDPIGRVATAVMFRRNALRIADARRAGGAPTWLYDFQQRSSVTGMSGHCLELPFTWNCLRDAHAVKVLGAGQPQALADEMHTAWVEFIREGDPGWEEGSGRCFGGDRRTAPFADVQSLA